MNDQQLLRYARHLMLDDIGIDGQRRLLSAHALVIGAGGLGCPVALYLGTAGVGRITVVDDDDVDVTNLQRQVAHNQSRLGQPKALSVQVSVAAINPDVGLRAVVRRADAALLDELVPQADVVLDCSDNFNTRQAVNAACVRHHKPLVWGAATGWDGQISSHDSRDTQSPCYACLFPPDVAFEDMACAQMGVLAPLVGMVGSMQAAEAIKRLACAGSAASLVGWLCLLDARGMAMDRIRVQRDPACGVCGAAGPTTGQAPQTPLSSS